MQVPSIIFFAILALLLAGKEGRPELMLLGPRLYTPDGLGFRVLDLGLFGFS